MKPHPVDHPPRAADERVVVGDAPVVVEPEDLAVVIREVLRGMGREVAGGPSPMGIF